MPFSEFFTNNPLTIFYSSGASSIGSALFQPRDEYPDLPAEMIQAWSFANTDTRAEHKDARAGMLTVKEFSVATLSPDAKFVVDDDRAGEISDLVVIEEARADGSWPVTLVHLKASQKAPGGRVDDLYEVLGQATRSVVWCDAQRMAARLLSRLKTGSSVLEGDRASLMALLSTWTHEPPPIRWTIASVQSGLKVSTVASSQNIKTLLNDYLEWLSQHDVIARVYGHA